MTTRLYSLFRKEGKRWVQVDPRAYAKPTAIRIFQNQLLDGSLSGNPLELRPVPTSKPSVIPPSQILCESCSNNTHNCTKGSCACGCRIIKG
jgi:hypothetical protein